MNSSRNSWPIVAAMIWSFLFGLTSFYWASGGMIGGATLGGEIYQMALARETNFIIVLWLTGIIKIAAGILLWIMLKDGKDAFFNRIVYFAIFISGIFLFIYGLLNFTTILLSILNILDLKIDSYARWWRLLFWEPYWMLGGILYIISSRRFAMKWKKSKPL